jgi:hypothetical protein
MIPDLKIRFIFIYFIFTDYLCHHNTTNHYNSTNIAFFNSFLKNDFNFPDSFHFAHICPIF